MTLRKNLPSILFSIIIIAFGVFVAWHGAHMSIGSLSRIGPGAFPFGIGVVLSFLGLVDLYSSYKNNKINNNTSIIDRKNARPIISMALAIIFFAIILETGGLVLSISSVIIIIMFGMRQLSIKFALFTIAVLSFIGILLFINALNLPINIFFTG